MESTTGEHNTPTNWDVTVQTKPSSDFENHSKSGIGCLVKIHPLELENKLVRISQSKTVMGRDPSSDVFCDDTSISRTHATIVRTANGFVIEDCHSTNGTFLNGQLVSRELLANGNQIQLGNHIFKFLAGDSIESQYHETIYSMMTKDGLTDVYNKRYLVETLSREFDRSLAYGRPFAVIMMDIDHFKGFNDTHGHLAGDEVLQEFARRIQSECQQNQVFGRFGGEEFMVVLIETELESAAKFAELLRAKICADPFDCCAGQLSVSASFGVAEFDKSRDACFSDLVEAADQHLYRAKQAGRNRVNFG